MISDTLWRSRFAASRDAIGRTVRLNGETFTIIGVMPVGFAYPEAEMAAWLALDLRPTDPAKGDAQSDRDDRYLFTVARLGDGVTLAQAREDLARVARDLRQAQPGDYPAGTWTLGIESLRARQFGRLQLPLAVLFAAAGSVLLIACVNVAIMALLRAVARRRELSNPPRHRRRPRRQSPASSLTEAAVIATLGAVAGTAVASAGDRRAGRLRASQRAEARGHRARPAGGAVLARRAGAGDAGGGSAPALVAMTLRGSEGIVGSTRVSDSRATAGCVTRSRSPRWRLLPRW